MSEQRQAVELTRAQAAAIVAEGVAAAGKAGSRATDCPYSPAGDATERVRVQAWLRGYLGAKREAAGE